MPENTIYVGRPSKWENPYKITKERTREIVLHDYKRIMLTTLEQEPDYLDELRGKDLACWCSLDEPCHADILLDMLNSLPTLKSRVSLEAT